MRRWTISAVRCHFSDQHSRIFETELALCGNKLLDHGVQLNLVLSQIIKNTAIKTPGQSPPNQDFTAGLDLFRNFRLSSRFYKSGNSKR